MKISEFLAHLGDSMQVEPSYSWRQALFLYDVLAYISDEVPEHGLSSYLDEEGQDYWDDIQNGLCSLHWAGADEGSYGFQIKEEYAYLPCYGEFLQELTRKLYGSKDIAFQKKLYREIKSLGFWNEEESLDMECDLMDKEVIKAILSVYHSFFAFAGTREDEIRMLLREFFYITQIEDEATGIGEWKLLHIESPALNAWLVFLYSDAVSSRDRSASMRILDRLVSAPVTLVSQNEELYMCSHESKSACFKRPQVETEYVPFHLTVMQNAYGNYNCSQEACFFWHDLLDPRFLSALIDAREFLEKMDRKYHFYSREQ